MEESNKDATNDAAVIFQGKFGKVTIRYVEVISSPRRVI